MSAFLPSRCQMLRMVVMLAMLAVAGIAGAAYYPAMTYGPKEPVAPGVTWQTASHGKKFKQRINIFEIDMSNRNVEVVPVFKSGGNVATAPQELTSAMATRIDAVAAINAGYFGSGLTNSYTEIDGVHLGGAGTNMTAENGRSIVGFSGNHQAIPKRTKLTSSLVPLDPTNWDKIVDAIAGRGHFVTANGVLVTVDNEATVSDHYALRHPRTVIGFSTNPYKVYMVTVDGRSAIALGMTYQELGQLMADLGVEQSISLDGGGSTTAWLKDMGIVNVPSDGVERYVISAWAVITGMTMDNTVEEVSVSGTWTTTTHSQHYYLNQLESHSSLGTSTVTWTPDLVLSGQYKVYAWWTAAPDRATAAPYVIQHAQGQDTVTVNQTLNGGQWVLLGSYPFQAGTAGSIQLSNSATGTVSADAIRVIRTGDMVSTPYVVTGTLFETDFETDQSSKFTVAQHIAGDNSIDFSYDYSAVSIPQSPSSVTGTRALRVGTNLFVGTPNSITATLTDIAGQGQMRITFDAWMNYGTSLTTEFMTFGASAQPSLPTMTGINYMTDPNQPFNGWFFAVSGEGGAAQDYRYYDGSGSAAIGNNAARADFLGTAAYDHASFTGVFPSTLFPIAGTVGKGWVRWEVVFLNGQIRLSATRPDNVKLLLCDWFTPNAGTPLSGLLPHLGTMDTYASLASPWQDNFVLYDNFKVESITAN